LSVNRSFLQYKSQCLEKVNVKYVIKRLWHEIFHMVSGINPRPISALQLRRRAWYGSLGLSPGPIWKMSCNNLLLSHILFFNNMLIISLSCGIFLWSCYLRIFHLTLVERFIDYYMTFFILPLLSARDLDIGPESFSLRGDISRGLMTRAIWKRPCINLFITYFARASDSKIKGKYRKIAI
jgi:hypothetical protein